MPVVIEAVCFADGTPCPATGCYLLGFDFEARDGRGAGDFTVDIGRARRFSTARDAWDYWRTQSRTVPLRDDGKANRPFTAFTILIAELEPEARP